MLYIYEGINVDFVGSISGTIHFILVFVYQLNFFVNSAHSLVHFFLILVIVFVAVSLVKGCFSLGIL